MPDICCYLNACTDHEQCVIYSCETDGVEDWRTHLPDDDALLSRLNGSYDTHDRRNNTLLNRDDYPAALVAEADADPETTTAPWWKPWAR